MAMIKNNRMKNRLKTTRRESKSKEKFLNNERRYAVRLQKKKCLKSRVLKKMKVKPHDSNQSKREGSRETRYGAMPRLAYDDAFQVL